MFFTYWHIVARFLFLLQIIRTMDFNRWNIFWSFCFGVMAFAIIVANTLSISILFKRRLRKRSHYLLISLSIADLSVGLFAIPLYMILFISRQNVVPILQSWTERVENFLQRRTNKDYNYFRASNTTPPPPPRVNVGQRAYYNDLVFEQHWFGGGGGSQMEVIHVF